MKLASPALVCGAIAAALLLSSCASSDAAAPATEAAVDKSETLFDKLPQKVQDAGQLVVAADDHPPYRSTAADGSITGIDADLWAALAPELGVEIKFEPAASLPAILTGLNSGRFDAYNGPLAATIEREEQFDMVAWLLNNVTYLYDTKKSDVSDIADICGKTVAYGAGNIIEGDLPLLDAWCVGEGLPATTPLPLKDTSATMLALSSGQADVVGISQSAAVDIINKTPDTYDYVIQGEEQGVQTALASTTSPVALELGPVLLEAFERIFESGQYTEIIEKWGLEDEAMDAPVLNPEVSE